MTTTDRPHSITWFRSAFDPLPSNEESGLSATQIIDRIAPEDGPLVAREKHRVPYFVPCLLKVAPFVGKTAERCPGQSGKQRSAAHMTASSWYAFDLDNVTLKQLESARCTLKASGFKFCIYSTHSHGRDPEKVRVRVLLFMDRALEPLEWQGVWHVLNASLLDGLADPQTARLSQQASIWCAPPSRVGAAFREVGGATPMNADDKLAQAPKRSKADGRSYTPPLVPSGLLVKRYAAALDALDSSDYAIWQTVLAGLRAAVTLGELSDEAGAALWLSWCASAPAHAKRNNDQPRHQPKALWDKHIARAAPPAALVGAIFARARTAAFDRVRAEGAGTAAGRAAAWYSAKFHRAAYDALITEMGQAHER